MGLPTSVPLMPIAAKRSRDGRAAPLSLYRPVVPFCGGERSEPICIKSTVPRAPKGARRASERMRASEL